MARVELSNSVVKRHQLPKLCMRCGAPATIHLDQTFKWVPPWVYFTLLAGPVVLALFILIGVTRMQISVPLCEAHKDHWKTRKLLLWSSTLIAILFICGGRYISGEEFNFPYLLPGFVLFLVAIIVSTVTHYTAIRASNIRDHGITLTGVSEAFAEAARRAGPANYRYAAGGDLF